LVSSAAPRPDFARPRQRMVQRLAGAGIVTDRRVLRALGAVPRHLLVPEGLREAAYREAALPIGEGQTISAPGVVGAMSQALELGGRETVLEVGTGSGYQAALLSRLAARVVTIERLPQLAARARSVLGMLGVANVAVHVGDGTRGRPCDAPFDAILVTAGGPEVPPPLLEQLAPGGRLVGPFGDRREQRLLRVRRTETGELLREVLGRCRFVQLVGCHGWSG